MSTSRSLFLLALAALSVSAMAGYARAEILIDPYPKTMSDASFKPAPLPEPETVLQPVFEPVQEEPAGEPVFEPLEAYDPPWEDGTVLEVDGEIVSTQEEEEHITWFDNASFSEWRAKQGANVMQILDEWSYKAGIDFVWNTQNQFAALETLEFVGTYEEAVRKLLEQYSRSQMRPAGVLHVDPASGRRVLVVEDGGGPARP